MTEAPLFDLVVSRNRLKTQLVCPIRDCAWQEYDNGLDEEDPGMTFALTFDPDEIPRAKGRRVEVRQRPRMAILREQGVNGHVEMAAAVALAGFESVDVHMTDLLDGRVDLAGFRSVQLSSRPADLFAGEAGPWMRLFRNAYAFVAASAR